MVEQVETDARGIVAPDRTRGQWDLERREPSSAVARLVDRYWVVIWSQPPGQPTTQTVLTHPVANLVLENGTAVLSGVATRTFVRDLTDTGRAFGVMFGPAGLRALVDAPAADLTDQTVPASSRLGPTVDDLATAVAAADPDAQWRLVDEWLAARIPDRVHPCEETARLVEQAVTDPDLARVDDLARLADVTVRTLQRRFLDHVGVPPKWVLRRYRLYEAGEAARAGTDVDWAAVAHDLGFSDQSHLVRDFTDAFGMTPARYAAFNQPPG